MGRIFWAALCVCGFGIAPSIVAATVACSVFATGKGASVDLLEQPEDMSTALRAVPAGDLVFFATQELAPTQKAGWIWVRHDKTQEDIWQAGIYGWMREENLIDCG